MTNVNQNSLKGSPELVREAVTCIPNDFPDRETYVAVGVALKVPLFRICERWSADSRDRILRPKGSMPIHGQQWREPQVADDLTEIGKGDRIRAALQKHEVQYLAKKFGISGQAAAGAVRAAGPMRAKVEAHIRAQKKAGAYR